MQVRKAVSITIHPTNPTPAAVEMRIIYSDASLIGPSSVLLPGAGSPGVGFKFFYSPLLPGEFSGSVTLVSTEVRFSHSVIRYSHFLIRYTLLLWG